MGRIIPYIMENENMFETTNQKGMGLYIQVVSPMHPNAINIINHPQVITIFMAANSTIPSHRFMALGLPCRNHLSHSKLLKASSCWFRGLLAITA